MAVMMGSAAALDVDGGTLQVGGDNDLTCQPANQNTSVQYKTAWVGSEKLVTQVKVDNFSFPCNDKNAQIELLSNGNTVLGTASGKVANGSTDWLPVNGTTSTSLKIDGIVKTYITVGDVTR
jgi:hypothetical protein